MTYNEMFVTKRSGNTEKVSFDKVLQRIKTKSQNLRVNPVEIAQKVCSRIYDGVHTSELDELAAQLCSSLIVDHPDYGVLGKRIIISNHHKNTDDCFYDTMKKMYLNVDEEGDISPLISDYLWEIVEIYKDDIEAKIDYSKDYNYDYFGFKTLEKAYLSRIKGVIVERPQHLLMRVSLWIHGMDIENAFDTYDRMSNFEFIHATPTMFNAGSTNPQASSCFLGEVTDSIQGIYDTLSDCAKISKFAGGIGLHIHDIRGKNSLIKGTNGKSSGIVPMLRVYNNTARYVNQSGRRNGSIAVYLEPWHTDIFDFIEMKKNHGAEEERARDLFYALWIPDLFMERVNSSGDWSLMCPRISKGLSDVYGNEFKELYERYEREGKYVKVVKAQDLWFKIIASQVETGTPYMLYKDSINRKTNHSHLGTIKSSNLCVAPDTMVLTRYGYMPIQVLENTEVEVWNGSEWSNVTVRCTSDDSELIQVCFSNGVSLECTHSHHFYVTNGDFIERIEACKLQIGRKLIPLSLDNIPISGNLIFKNAYEMGIVSIYLSECKEKVSIPYNKSAIIKSFPLEWEWKCYGVDIVCDIPGDMKYFTNSIPLGNINLDDKLEWFAGIVDAASHVPHIDDSINIYVADFMSLGLKLFLQEFGILCKIVRNVAMNKHLWIHQITINYRGTEKLKKLGINKYLKWAKIKLNVDFEPEHEPEPDYIVEDDVYVESIVHTGRRSKTFCFTESKRGMGVFNGIITGQCTEIMEYTSPDEIAVCNLASICLPTFVCTETKTYDFKRLHKIARILTRNLNHVIDKTFYPVDKARKSNLLHRPIGIGVQGLADTFAKMRFPFDSDSAKDLNRKIFETMYHGAMEESILIAEERAELNEKGKCVYNEYEGVLQKEGCKYPGAYATFEGSPLSKGIFQHDMWDNVILSGMYDWGLLRERVIKHGSRNSLLIAPMPTASTSQIMGFNEAFEAFTANLYKRKTLAGEFIVTNKYLMKDLINMGLWNKEMKEKLMLMEGSIQKIDGIPDDIKDLYKTVWDITQRCVIDMAADRGAFICQSQSMNIFLADPKVRQVTSMHFYAWNKGLKTGMYYLRIKPKVNAQQFTIVPKNPNQNQNQNKKEIEGNYSDSDSECLNCSA